MVAIRPWEWIVILIGITLSPWAFWRAFIEVKNRLTSENRPKSHTIRHNPQPESSDTKNSRPSSPN